MITLDSLEETRQRVTALQPPNELKIKGAIERLSPEIEDKLKAGCTFKMIAPVIYDGLGLTAEQAKRENFWRTVARFHKAPRGGLKTTPKPPQKKKDAPLVEAEAAELNQPHEHQDKPADIEQTSIEPYAIEPEE